MISWAKKLAGSTELFSRPHARGGAAGNASAQPTPSRARAGSAVRRGGGEHFTAAPFPTPPRFSQEVPAAIAATVAKKVGKGSRAVEEECTALLVR